MDRKTLWIGVLGLAVGAGGAVSTRSHWLGAIDDCGVNCKTRPAKTICPAHFEKGEIVVTNAAETERVRVALMDGVFAQWLELGRAPTPEEIGRRLKLDENATDALMGELAACGDAANFGIHPVPESALIAVAWPLANVPTGIDVTVEGKKTVHARCAIDSLGVSKMMGAKASVDAKTHDGVALHVEVDGDRLVNASPADAVVWKGGSCDDMMFFSSQAALDAWAKDHHTEGRSFKIDEAVKHGADIFGRLARPLHE